MIDVSSLARIAALLIAIGVLVSAPRSAAAAGGTVQGTVFKDANFNNMPDPGEGISGSIIEIVNGSGALLAKTLTDSSGRYSVSSLPAGPITVRLKYAPGVTLLSPMTSAAILVDGGATTVSFRITSR